MTVARSYKDLEVYKNAMEAAMDIYQITRGFPLEEKYSMVDQIRRSSRSVCANIAEAWRRRRYKGAFVNRLNESESEAAETQVWVEFGFRCGYIDGQLRSQLDDRYDHIMSQLMKMIRNVDDWIMKGK